MPEQSTKRPSPVPDPLSRPFWDAARERRLAIQRCHDCGRYYHPPVPLCGACLSADLAFSDVSGEGLVATLTIVRSSRIAGMEGQSLAVLGVEIVEQDRLIVLGNLVEARVEDARIGLRVEVTFEELDGFVLPQFRPATEN